MKNDVDPGLAKVLADFGENELGHPLADVAKVVNVSKSDGGLTVEISLGFPADRYQDRLISDLTPLIEKELGISPVRLSIDWRVAAHAVQATLKPLGQVKNVIAVASGKGGVGKSTTAVNLALALAREGAKTGILDADIYGPSLPQMLGLGGQRPGSTDGKTMQPLQAHGISAMSIGFLIDQEQAMVWRGPMVTQALTQLINDTVWGELDYLIVDMPPGTGDTQLTLSQKVPLSGAIIVTTPQDIALLDARKGLKMFEKVSVPVLGIVENMSTHICSQCGHEEHVFGSGGGQKMAEQYNVPLLGSLPLDIQIRENMDSGNPTVVADEESPVAMRYQQLALRMGAQLAAKRKDYSHLFPKISIEER
ncbi:MAG: iron-sulfur cluster carrier protein ApbC [Gammaproteobacteria bacterium]|nr:iron-sulfur cluster carrier protein ApbC [Gammaproteobacteria bacterium]MCZ6826559.1 iron-sulfur cluster carrier protein ApbC [Gammaproteobacteria bacterium]